MLLFITSATSIDDAYNNKTFLQKSSSRPEYDQDG